MVTKDKLKHNTLYAVSHYTNSGQYCRMLFFVYMFNGEMRVQWYRYGDDRVIESNARSLYGYPDKYGSNSRRSFFDAYDPYGDWTYELANDDELSNIRWHFTEARGYLLDPLKLYRIWQKQNI